MLPRLLLLMVSSLSGVYAALWPVIPLEERWEGLGIIAIVNVGPVHAVETPEGIMLQSAEAHIERAIYRKNPLILPGENNNTIHLFSVLPNGKSGETGGLVLESGRAFIMMKQHGYDAFFPSDPWEFQPLPPGRQIQWPTNKEITPLSLDEVIRIVEGFTSSRPKR